MARLTNPHEWLFDPDGNLDDLGQSAEVVDLFPPPRLDPPARLASVDAEGLLAQMSEAFAQCQYA